jgi:hypothetical protein
MSVQGPSTGANEQAKPWTRDEALSLFKAYENMGWGAKQQMIRIVVWLTPFIFGLIAFSVRSHCLPSASTSASPASAAALALSTFMLVMIWGTLKRADNIYKRAARVIDDANAKGLLPSTIYEIVSYGQEKKHCLRLGLDLIAPVYISFVYVAFFILVVGSLFLWARLKRVAGLFCESAGLLMNAVLV